MKVMRILGALAIAVCALAALASSGASAAMVLPTFSVQTNGTSTSGAGTLFGAAEIRAADDSDTFTMNADRRSGTFHIDFLESKALGQECHTAGDLAGIILLGGNYKLVLDTLGGVDHHLILFEPEEAKIECKFLSTRVVVKGNVLGTIVSTGTSGKEYKVDVNATSKTGQEYKEYENDAAEKVKTQLLSNTNGGAFSESGESALATF